MSALSSTNHHIIRLIIKTLQEVKSECIKVIDVREQTTLFSYMIIATGVSSRQVRAMSQSVVQALKENHYDSLLGVEGLENGQWVLVDAGDVVLHAMLPAIRQFYDLEELWEESHDNHYLLKANTQ